MKYDITALGEILIDFAPAGKDSFGDSRYTQKAGGAPLNLLATAAKAGLKTAFIGKVGNDMFGKFLKNTVKECGVSDEGICTDKRHNTTLAFVSLSENGDREFSFFRNYGADVFLEKSDIPIKLIEQSAVFHFGSLSLTSEPARSATEFALLTAQRAGCMITYDPNYRAPLWENRKQAVSFMKQYLSFVDILKISKEELLMITGAKKTANAVKAVMSSGVRLVLVTDGPNGAGLYMKDCAFSAPAYPAETIDTTGAGDIFFGSFLSAFLKDGQSLATLTPQKAEEYLKFAIKVSALSTEHHGAIASIPDIKEIK